MTTAEQKAIGQARRTVLLEVIGSASGPVTPSQLLAHPKIVEAGIGKKVMDFYLRTLKKEGKISQPEMGKYQLGGKSAVKAPVKATANSAPKREARGLSALTGKQRQEALVRGAKNRAAIIEALTAGPLTRSQIENHAVIKREKVPGKNISNLLFSMYKSGQVVHARTADGQSGWAIAGTVPVEPNPRAHTNGKAKPKPSSGMGLEIDQAAGTFTITMNGKALTVKVA